LEATTAPKVFLTGLPGCGKTTLIKDIAEAFDEIATGFVTEEVCDEKGRRIGFDLVGFPEGRGVLARAGTRAKHRVGRYSVFLADLEDWALDLLQPTPQRPFVILDEVGKMECCSKRFQDRVHDILDSPCPVLGSVARRGTGLIGRIHEHPGVRCVEVKPENRQRIRLDLKRIYGDFLRALSREGPA
jgi:nucleoside-triphosphatase